MESQIPTISLNKVIYLSLKDQPVFDILFGLHDKQITYV